MQNTVFKILTNEFANKQKKNPAYSLRSFARKLEMHPSALSEIFNAKRSITPKMAEKILTKLGFANLEINSIVHSTKLSQSQLLELEYFKVISDWQYFAVLSLAELPNCKNDPAWISKRLNITKTVAKKTIHKLLKLELLEETNKGNLRATGVQFKTPTDLVNASMKNHLSQSLEKAKESLFRDSVEVRDFSAVTLTFDISKIDDAKKMIKRFKANFQKKFETPKNNEVYKLAVQFFPLTKVSQNNA